MGKVDPCPVKHILPNVFTVQVPSFFWCEVGLTKKDSKAKDDDAKRE